MSGPHVAAPTFVTCVVAVDSEPARGCASDQDPHRATSGAGTALVYGRARTAPRSHVPPRAGRAHAGVVHAPGGAFAPRVPGATRASRLLRAGRNPGAVRGGDASTGAPPRRRCRGALRGHHDAGACHGPRRPARRRSGADGGAADPYGRRRQAPAAGHASAGDAGGNPPRPRGAVSRAGARRLLRRPVHGRLLPRRRARQPRLPRSQGADVPGAVGLARAARAAHRDASPPTSRRRWTPAPT